MKYQIRTTAPEGHPLKEIEKQGLHDLLSISQLCDIFTMALKPNDPVDRDTVIRDDYNTEIYLLDESEEQENVLCLHVSQQSIVDGTFSGHKKSNIQKLIKRNTEDGGIEIIEKKKENNTKELERDFSLSRYGLFKDIYDVLNREADISLDIFAYPMQGKKMHIYTGRNNRHPLFTIEQDGDPYDNSYLLESLIKKSLLNLAEKYKKCAEKIA